MFLESNTVACGGVKKKKLLSFFVHLSMPFLLLFVSEFLWKVRLEKKIHLNLGNILNVASSSVIKEHTRRPMTVYTHAIHNPLVACFTKFIIIVFWFIKMYAKWIHCFLFANMSPYPRGAAIQPFVSQSNRSGGSTSCFYSNEGYHLFS